MADFESDVDAWAAHLLSLLDAPARRKLARQVGTALRRAQIQRIRAQQTPDGAAYEPRRPRRAKRDKKHATGVMFRKLASASELKLKATDTGVLLGFTGRVARIARVHQYGLADDVGPTGPRVQYPARPLLGFSAADRELIRSQLIELLGPS